jgi:DNA-binding PadR family transcriptional regulator
VSPTRPISEQAFLVLTALTDEPLHGYAIVKAVGELTEEHVRLSVGTLYGVLDRLAADGLVERDRDETHQGRQRRYYRLTDDGAAALAAEAERLAANVRAATRRLHQRGLRPAHAGGVA